MARIVSMCLAVACGLGTAMAQTREEILSRSRSSAERHADLGLYLERYQTLRRELQQETVRGAGTRAKVEAPQYLRWLDLEAVELALDLTGAGEVGLAKRVIDSLRGVKDRNLHGGEFFLNILNLTETARRLKSGEISLPDDLRREVEGLGASVRESRPALVSKVYGLILDKPIPGPSQIEDAQSAAEQWLRDRALKKLTEDSVLERPRTGEMAPSLETLRLQREQLRQERMRSERLQRVESQMEASRVALGRAMNRMKAASDPPSDREPKRRPSLEQFEQNERRFLEQLGSSERAVPSPIPTTRTDAAAARGSRSEDADPSGFSAPGKGDPREMKNPEEVLGYSDEDAARTHTHSGFGPDGTPTVSELDLNPLREPSSRSAGHVRLAVRPGQRRVDLIVPLGMSVVIPGLELDRARGVWTAPVPEGVKEFSYSLYWVDRESAYLADRAALAEAGQAIWESPLRRADVPRDVDQFIRESLSQGHSGHQVVGQAVARIARYSQDQDCRPDAIDAARTHKTYWLRLALAQYRTQRARLPLVCSGFTELYVALGRLYLKGTSVLGLRVAYGYQAGGTFKKGHAHAWVESFFAGEGWRIVEPQRFTEYPAQEWVGWVGQKLAGLSWRQIAENPQILKWADLNLEVLVGLEGLSEPISLPLAHRPFKSKEEFRQFLLRITPSPTVSQIRRQLHIAVIKGEVPADYLDAGDFTGFSWYDIARLPAEDLDLRLPALVEYLLRTRSDALRSSEVFPGTKLGDRVGSILRGIRSEAAVREAPWAFATTDPAQDPQVVRDSVENYFLRFRGNLPVLMETLKKRRAAGVPAEADRAAVLSTGQKIIYIAALGPTSFENATGHGPVDREEFAKIPQQVFRTLDPEEAKIDLRAYSEIVSELITSPEVFSLVYDRFLKKQKPHAGVLQKKIVFDGSIRPMLSDLARLGHFGSDASNSAGYWLSSAWSQEVTSQEHWIRDLQKLVDEDLELALLARSALAQAESVFGESWAPIRERIARAIFERSLPVNPRDGRDLPYLSYEPLRQRELARLSGESEGSAEAKVEVVAQFGTAEELERELRDGLAKLSESDQLNRAHLMCRRLFLQARYSDRPEVCAAVFDRLTQEIFERGRAEESRSLKSLPERQQELFRAGPTELGIPLDPTSRSSMAGVKRRGALLELGRHGVMLEQFKSLLLNDFSTEVSAYPEVLNRGVLDVLDDEILGRGGGGPPPEFPWARLRKWVSGTSNQKLTLSRLALVLAPEAMADLQGRQDFRGEIEALAPEFPCTLGWLAPDPSRYLSACLQRLESASSVAMVFLLRNAVALRAAGQTLPPALELRLLVRAEELLEDEVGNRDCVLECDGQPSVQGILSVRLADLRSKMKAKDLVEAIRAGADTRGAQLAWRLSAELSPPAGAPGSQLAELAGLRELLVDRVAGDPGLKRMILRQPGESLALDHRLGARTVPKIAAWIPEPEWDSERADLEFSKVLPVFLSVGRPGLSPDEQEALFLLVGRFGPRLSERTRRAAAAQFVGESRRAFDFYPGQVMLLRFAMELDPTEEAGVFARAQATPWRTAGVDPRWVDPLLRKVGPAPAGPPVSEVSPRADAEFEQRVRAFSPGQGSPLVTAATRPAFRAWLGRFLERKLTEQPLPPELEKTYGAMIREYRKKVPAAGERTVLEKARRGEFSLQRVTDRDSLEMKVRLHAILKEAGIEVGEFPELELIQELAAESKTNTRTGVKEGGEAGGGQGEERRAKGAR